MIPSPMCQQSISWLIIHVLATDQSYSLVVQVAEHAMPHNVLITVNM